MFTPDLSTPRKLGGPRPSPAPMGASASAPGPALAPSSTSTMSSSPRPRRRRQTPGDPSFADDPYMADLSRAGHDPGEIRPKKKRATTSFEHTEDREVTTDIPQIHESEVRLK